MKFIEAKEKLKVLAEGTYHSIGYNIAEHEGGTQITSCYLYINPRITATASTWREAFMKLEHELGIETTEEIPEV